MSAVASASCTTPPPLNKIIDADIPQMILPEVSIERATLNRPRPSMKPRKIEQIISIKASHRISDMHKNKVLLSNELETP